MVSSFDHGAPVEEFPVIDDDIAPIDDTKPAFGDIDPQLAELLGEVGIDLPPIDDTNPFGDLDPQFRRLAEHLMGMFDPRDLPAMIRPLAGAAQGILVQKFAGEPTKTRQTVLELITIAVTDLGIELQELGDCWTVDGNAADPV
jgi:hypothetical protein